MAAIWGSLKPFLLIKIYSIHVNGNYSETGKKSQLMELLRESPQIKQISTLVAHALYSTPFTLCTVYHLSHINNSLFSTA